MLKPKSLVNKNFLSSLDISKEEFLDILDLAKNFKNKTLESVSYTHLRAHETN